MTLAIRSEAVSFTTDMSACGIAGMVRETRFAGGMLRIDLELSDGTRLVASRHGIDLGLTAGDRVQVTWAADSAVPVDREAPQ